MRLYRRFDADLIALNESGIPVNVLAEVLIEAYAKGKRIKIIPEGCVPFDVGNRKHIHLTVTVRGKEAEELVSHIKRGYRNQFSKSIIRDALETDPLWVYLDDDSYVEKENERMESIDDVHIIRLPYGLRRNEYRKLLGSVMQEKKSEKDKTPKRERQEKQPEKKPEKKDENKRKPDRKPDPEKPVTIPDKIPIIFDDLEGWDEEIDLMDDADMDMDTDTNVDVDKNEDADLDVRADADAHTNNEADPEDSGIDNLIDSFDSIF
jgi:hypothetical protein